MDAGLCLGALNPLAVVLSDMPEVHPLLAANILLNRAVSSADEISSSEPVPARSINFDCFSAAPQLWGTPLHASILDKAASVSTGDVVVVAADVVYDPIGYAPLVQTIQDLLLSSHTRSSALADCLILAQRHRNPEDYKFFDMIRNPASKLVVQEIVESFDTIRQGHDEGSTGTTLQDIKTFKITAARSNERGVVDGCYNELIEHNNH